METVYTKINTLNQKFKSNAIVSSLVNMLMLVLVLVFFSIGFDLTKKLLFDFIELSWANIFPTVVDLLTVAGLIITLKNFSNILNSPQFFLQIDETDLNDEKTDKQPKVVEFLNNNILGKLVLVMWYVIVLCIINFLLNIFLEGINNQFSPLNEWYLLSSNFTHLPIFPINLLCVIILVGIVLPTALNYAKYKLAITEVSHAVKKENIKQQVTEIKTYRFLIFVALSIICIILSVIQRNNIWFFQYNKPINEQSILSEKLNEKASGLCDTNLRFNTLHSQNVITAKIINRSEYNNTTTTSYDNYAITPELKEYLQTMCEKKAEVDRKIAEQKEKELEEKRLLIEESYKKGNK